MAQTYQMKHNAQGTIYSLLTVESDGQMTMTFHGTDREISHEVTENADGWLCYPGAMFPGLEIGRWKAVAAQMRNEKLEMNNRQSSFDLGQRNENEKMRNEVAESETTTDGTDCTDNEPLTVNPEPFLRPDSSKRPKAERTVNPEPLTIDHQPSAIDHQPSDIDRPQPSSTLKAIGMVAAATVALVVIYETGLLIPLGLIGLATGGILK